MSITSNLSSTAVSAALGVAKRVSRYLPEPVAQGVDFVASMDNAQNEIGVSSEYQELIDKQINTQRELQQVSFTSNIEKSQHESRMAAVRNIRVS